MRFDTTTTGKMLDRYPELERIEGFKELSDKVIRYIILIYSADTILSFRSYGILEQRKRKALQMIGIDPEEPYVQGVLTLEEEGIVDIIVEYLKFQDNYLWQDICATEQELEEITALRLTPLDQEEKDKDLLGATKNKYSLGATFSDKRDQLKKFYEQFYLNDAEVAEEIKARPTRTLEDRVRRAK